MGLSRREFLKLIVSLMGGWAVTIPKPYSLGELVRISDEMDDLRVQGEIHGAEDREAQDGDAERRILNSSTERGSERNNALGESGISTNPEDERVLKEIGYINEISPQSFAFDENKYSPPKRQLEPSEWDTTNRHLPIKIDPSVINKPGERSPQAIKRVVEYTPFLNPRYVAAPGKRVTMCNIAAWDWSRALQVHLPHWIGETEMSANMLFRWISHPQAGGLYGEGWQSVQARSAQLLANRGIPVFALAENSKPRRHGHVALVYPENLVSWANNLDVGPYFVSVNNGRSHGGNGIKNLRNTFRWLTPSYFVHKIDFIVYQDS